MLRRPNPLRARSPATNPTPSSEIRSSTPPSMRCNWTRIVARAGVAGRVGQRFLRDPKQAQRDIGIERAELVLGSERHLELMVLFDVSAETSQWRHQTGVLQHAGMQLVREIADGVGKFRRAALQCRHRLLDFRAATPACRLCV